MTIPIFILGPLIRGRLDSTTSSYDGQNHFVSVSLPKGFALHLQCPSAESASRVVYEIQRLRERLVTPVADFVNQVSALFHSNF